MIAVGFHFTTVTKEQVVVVVGVALCDRLHFVEFVIYNCLVVGFPGCPCVSFVHLPLLQNLATVCPKGTGRCRFDMALSPELPYGPPEYAIQRAPC